MLTIERIIDELGIEEDELRKFRCHNHKLRHIVARKIFVSDKSISLITNHSEIIILFSKEGTSMTDIIKSYLISESVVKTKMVSDVFSHEELTTEGIIFYFKHNL